MCVLSKSKQWILNICDQVGAAPLPDNRPDDKYLYEILVFTGNKMEAQTDSLVQFILSGEHGDSDVRTFGDTSRQIFRKGATDAFVMANDKYVNDNRGSQFDTKLNCIS